MKLTVRWTKITDAGDDIDSNSEKIGLSNNKNGNKNKDYIHPVRTNRNKIANNKNKKNTKKRKNPSKIQQLFSSIRNKHKRGENEQQERSRLESLDLGVIEPAGHSPFNDTNLNNTVVRVGNLPIQNHVDDASSGDDNDGNNKNKNRHKTQKNPRPDEDVSIRQRIDLAQTQHAIYTIGDDSETDNYADSENSYNITQNINDGIISDDSDDSDDEEQTSFLDDEEDDNDSTPLKTKTTKEKRKKQRKRKNRKKNKSKRNKNKRDRDRKRETRLYDGLKVDVTRSPPGDDRHMLVKGISRGIFSKDVDIVEIPIITPDAPDIPVSLKIHNYNNNNNDNDDNDNNNSGNSTGSSSASDTTVDDNVRINVEDEDENENENVDEDTSEMTPSSSDTDDDDSDLSQLSSHSDKITKRKNGNKNKNKNKHKSRIRVDIDGDNNKNESRNGEELDMVTKDEIESVARQLSSTNMDEKASHLP